MRVEVQVWDCLLVAPNTKSDVGQGFAWLAGICQGASKGKLWVRLEVGRRFSSTLVTRKVSPCPTEEESGGGKRSYHMTWEIAWMLLQMRLYAVEFTASKPSPPSPCASSSLYPSSVPRSGPRVFQLMDLPDLNISVAQRRLFRPLDCVL